jgi:hypothetical protein
LQLKKNAHIKLLPNRRKFAQSGHPDYSQRPSLNGSVTVSGKHSEGVEAANKSPVKAKSSMKQKKLGTPY